MNCIKYIWTFKKYDDVALFKFYFCFIPFFFLNYRSIFILYVYLFISYTCVFVQRIDFLYVIKKIILGDNLFDYISKKKIVF